MDDTDATNPKAVVFIRSLTAWKLGLWWILFLVDLGVGGMYWNKTPNKKRWLLYKIILGVAVLRAINTSVYLSYIDTAMQESDRIDAVSGAYIFFSNLTGGAFIGLVMLLSVGFCMTRMDLGMHKQKVIWCPLIVFFCGLSADYLFYYLETVDYADQASAVQHAGALPYGLLLMLHSISYYSDPEASFAASLVMMR